MERENKSRRVLVIGWDGGSFNLLDRMIHKGIMPHLQELIKSGVRAPLISTIPPLTSPAWTSFRTGKSPANHGLFGFFKAPESSLDSKSIERHTAESIQDAAFWNMLNRHGKKVCVVDMPLTDPVEEIDGVMVSGMMTRGKRGVMTYPEGVKSELLEAFVGCFDKTLADGVDTSVKYLEHLTASLEWKKNEDLFLMQKYEWDCFATVFSAVDALQHYFWRFIDPESKAYTRAVKISERIDTFFGKLDDILKCYLDQLHSDDCVFIVSDHGFGPADYAVYVNNLLEELGYVKIKHAGSNAGRRLLDMTRLKKVLKKIDVLGLRSRMSSKVRGKIKGLLEGRGLPVIWPETKAFFRANSEEGIYINVKGELKDGCVEVEDRSKCVAELIEKLAGLTNPENGQRVFEYVKKREDVHDGVYQDDAPDIVLRPARGYVPKFYRHGAKPVEEYDDPFLSGTHSREGIFIAAGNCFRQDLQAGAIHIEDFAPILLYTFGLPVCEDMDGRISTEIFDGESWSANPPVYEASRHLGAKQFQQAGSTLEEDEIKKQLSQLGYID